MFKGIINWVKKLVNKPQKVTAQASITKRKTRTIPVSFRPTDPNTKIYLSDPTYPYLIVNSLEPADTMLAMRSIGEMGGGYPLGTIQQQALALKIMVHDALVYMSSKSPKQIKQWAAVQSLILMPRAGKDINAYYDRGSLRFFFFGDPKRSKNIFTCDARPIVVHEFGHAFLDILRPDWWNTQSAEVWAFHESFGDMTSAIISLQHDALIDFAVAETDGNLMKSNVITRLAAEMGTGLYNITGGKNGENLNCLRDMTQYFKYIEPEKLPERGRDDQLLSECHSFSRVFTGAFWEILVKIGLLNAKEKGCILREGMKASRDIVTSYLLKAVVQAPTTVRLFDAIAQQILAIDHAEGGKYQTIIRDVFSQRGILRQNVMMLEDLDVDSLLKDIKEPHEVQNYGDIKIIRTLTTKTMKLSDKLGPLTALDYNPLFDLEITVPDQTAYYFDKDKLVGISASDEGDIIDAAYNRLQVLNEENLVGNHDSALFENKDGKLVRKQIICTCGRPNYCDPNAPEYGKPWKPANNSGCINCKSNCEPRSCDCNKSVPITPSPKIGCYTSVKTGGAAMYKHGSNASRKVC
jgi:hypothetical protein